MCLFKRCWNVWNVPCSVQATGGSWSPDPAAEMKPLIEMGAGSTVSWKGLRASFPFRFLILF